MLIINITTSLRAKMFLLIYLCKFFLYPTIMPYKKNVYENAMLREHVQNVLVVNLNRWYQHYSLTQTSGNCASLTHKRRISNLLSQMVNPLLRVPYRLYFYSFTIYKNATCSNINEGFKKQNIYKKNNRQLYKYTILKNVPEYWNQSILFIRECEGQQCFYCKKKIKYNSIKHIIQIHIIQYNSKKI